MNRALVVTFVIMTAAFAIAVVTALIVGWRATRKSQYEPLRPNPDDEPRVVSVPRPLELEAAKS
jgi:hypothetical protein